MTYIKNKKALTKFIREQPQWFQRLSRNPWELKEFERACSIYYKRQSRSNGATRRGCKWQNDVIVASIHARLSDLSE